MNTRSKARQYSLFLAATAALASALAALDARAQAIEYTETVLFDGGEAATLEGVDPGFADRISIIGVSPGGLSLNNKGNYGGVVTVLDSGANSTSTTDDIQYDVLLRGSDDVLQTAEIAMQPVNGGQQCALSNPTRCVQYNFLGRAFLSDGDDLAFLAGGIIGGRGPGQTVGRVSLSGAIDAIVRTGDNGFNFYFPDAFTAFNNLGDVAGTFSADCPPEFGSAGFLADGSEGPIIRRLTTTIPPKPTYFDSCDGSGIDYQILSDVGLAPNTDLGVFFGFRDTGSGSSDRGFFTVDSTLDPVFTGVTSVPVGKVAVRDNGDFVFIRNRQPSGSSAVFTEVVYVRNSGAGYSEFVLATEENADFEEIAEDAVAVNASGVVAFVAARSAMDGFAVWTYDTTTDTTSRAGGGPEFTGDILLATDGINDRGEILVAGTDDQGNVRIVKYSPPQPPEPDIGVDRPGIDFGVVPVGLSSDVTVTVTNFGTVELLIDSIAVPAASAYSVVNNTCPATLDASASCTFDVRFSPSADGRVDASAEIASNDPDTPVLSISLTGTGTTIPIPAIQVPAVVEFPDTNIGDTSVRTVTIENVGTSVLNVTAIVPPLAPFAVVSDECNAPTVIVAGGSCTFEVGFSPDGVVDFEGQIQVTSNDPNSPDVQIALQGRGIVVAEFVITDTAEPTDDGQIDFGNQLIRQLASEWFTLTNVALGPVTIGVVSIGATSDAVFSVPAASDGCSNVTIATDESCTVEVLFESGEAGVFSGTVDVAVVDNNPVSVALAGSASVSQHDVGVSIASDVTAVAPSTGEEFELTIRATNEGPSLARDVELTVRLPAATTLSNPPGCNAGSNCFDDGQGGFSPVWVIGDLPVDTTYTAIIRLQEALNSNSPTTCLESTVVATSEVGDGNTDNDSASVLVGGGNCGDLAVVTRISGGGISANQVGVTATTRVTNNGPDDIAAVSVNGIANLQFAVNGPTFVVDSVSGCNNPPPSSGGSTYACDAGPLEAGRSLEIVMDATITVTSVDEIEVQYDVASSGSDDLNAENDTASATTMVAPLLIPVLPAANESIVDCFIATAAYGSYLEPDVLTLRRFRDRWLITNAPGRAFVDWYYRTSPPIADVIAKDETLRFVVRILLTPVVFAIKNPGVILGFFFIGFIRLSRREQDSTLLPSTRV